MITTGHKHRAFQILQNYRQNDSLKYYKTDTLEQSIVYRFNLSNLSTIEDYLQFLENSNEEKRIL